MSATQSISLRRLSRRMLLAAMVLPSMSLAFPGDHVPFRFSDGWEAYESGKYQKAVDVWSALAQQGHINAQTNLGFMYDYGRGVNRNRQLAAHWYRAAATKGSAAGQYNLSVLIAEGHVKPRAGHSAHFWLEKAAEQGFEDALKALDRERNTAPLGHGAPAQKLPAEASETKLGLTHTRAYTVEVPVSIGTAWPVAAGYAVTNHHVIDGKQQVMLINKDGDELLARVIASDAANDIAFLRVNTPDRLPPALPLSLHSAPLGASVFTIGFPRIDVMGRSPKLSQGIISSANGLRDDPSSYQISVPIQQGNSGGPLMNMRGEVVGMITSMLGSTDTNSGPAQPIPNISYALKIDVIRRLLADTPRRPPNIDVLSPATGDLQSLAARVQDSVLIVMAE